jgi:hypothetical protein
MEVAAIVIGVNVRENQINIVEEFFQLFKTPWELYSSQKTYDVVISTEDVTSIETKLLILFNSKPCKVDLLSMVQTQSHDTPVFLRYAALEYPIYSRLLTFDAVHPSLIQTRDSAEAAGLIIDVPHRRFLRIGYDLFAEVAFLLSKGQPPENALIPTLEFHILTLREWILEAGIPLVEIPPIPAGYKFFVSLTHDVDFVGIRRHKFDHTLLGFIYRALVGSVLAMLKKRFTWSKVLKNWKAVLSLSGVYLGLSRDFWYQFDQYLEIEKNLGATFFFIPFKDNPGIEDSIKAPKRRAVRYDICDIPILANKILKQGHEIGLHGIDAWHDSEKGNQELWRIRDAVGSSDIGLRMHWLYYDQHSPQILDKVGFIYDSTFGYNDAVGYRAGTAQAFRPPGAQTLLELPLHIMDTALFYQKRMNLSDLQASAICERLTQGVLEFGGCLTINWHHRSVAPERLWGDFYTNLVENLRKRGACFMTAMRIVRWFQKRREVMFEEVHFTKSNLRLRFKQVDFNDDLMLLLRIYLPSQRDSTKENFSIGRQSYLEVQLSHKRDMEITF